MSAIGPEEAILSIVAASPGRQVHGKKRIQKLSFFCKQQDACIESRFRIRHFGVFSTEIAEALELLCVFGDLKTEEEQVGPNRFFSTVFSLPANIKYTPEPSIAAVAGFLGDFSTPVLEVASTIAYFRAEGWTEADAIKETKKLKPTISTSERLATSKVLLKKLATVDAAIHEKRSEGS